MHVALLTTLLIALRPNFADHPSNMQHVISIPATALIDGEATGPILWSDVPLSFWGGIAPTTGQMIDQHHPLCGSNAAGRILCLPSGKGSCTGSLALLELLVAGKAPAALVVCEEESILPLGVMGAEMFFGRTMPIVRVTPDDFVAIGRARYARIEPDSIRLGDAPFTQLPAADTGKSIALPGPGVVLEDRDHAFLQGNHGPAAQLAMQAIVRVAGLMGAQRLIDVSAVHVDACIYTGPAALAAAEKMAALGGRFAVPTTLNAISVDRLRWRELGCAPATAEPAARLADVLTGMGAELSFTCAPYLLDNPPQPGAMIAWGESNAVVYANSVLGARTLKTPDLLDIFIGLTGRAPFAGPYLDAQRQPTLIIEMADIAEADDSLFPLLGHLVGSIAGGAIPLVEGLERYRPSPDDLKAFGAAFATTSSAPMFHIAGVTPEAGKALPAALPRVALGLDAIRSGFRALDAADDTRIDLVALGNPHLSLDELARIAALCAGRKRHHGTSLVLTVGRAVMAKARAEGLTTIIEQFGGLILNDTCWCMIGEPVIAADARTIMTNSGKFAHYGPGLTGRAFRFGSLAACIEAAMTGQGPKLLPEWLNG